MGWNYKVYYFVVVSRDYVRPRAFHCHVEMEVHFFESRLLLWWFDYDKPEPIRVNNEWMFQCLGEKWLDGTKFVSCGWMNKYLTSNKRQRTNSTPICRQHKVEFPCALQVIIRFKNKRLECVHGHRGSFEHICRFSTHTVTQWPRWSEFISNKTQIL